MSRFVAHVTVMLKPLVNDPAGLAVRDGLQALGFEGVESVRVGKRLQVTLSAPGPDEAASRVRAMCDQLLANPVIEDFLVEIADGASDS
ncbi:MAG: phosphoribosylformylglycinamidine synthase subunit PurS [Chloroflexi bacterium]|nr:phosphoribosylformylglycinamidine synthase subunit PurS [Chloroflexota bacterium]